MLQILEWGNWRFFWLVTNAARNCNTYASSKFVLTMCEEWMWDGFRFIFPMDRRTGKLSAWITKETKKLDLNVKCTFGGLTMVKRTRLLFSLVYFMGELCLTSQQVLRIGKLQESFLNIISAVCWLTFFLIWMHCFAKSLGVIQSF